MGQGDGGDVARLVDVADEGLGEGVSRRHRRRADPGPNRQVDPFGHVTQRLRIVTRPALQQRQVPENVGQRAVVAFVLGALAHLEQPAPGLGELAGEAQQHPQAHADPVDHGNRFAVGLGERGPIQQGPRQAVTQAQFVVGHVLERAGEDVGRGVVDLLHQFHCHPGVVEQTGCVVGSKIGERRVTASQEQPVGARLAHRLLTPPGSDHAAAGPILDGGQQQQRRDAR